MTIDIASGVGPSKIDIAYERLGPEDGPPVVLVMGAGAQLIHWPDGLCEGLVARGLHLIRFDNRDAGESTHLRDAGEPSFADPSTAPYTLADMAGDTLGLLDRLGIASAHFVGASLGGFVAQMIAIHHPKRLRSLTSIMSSTGNPTVGRPAPTTLASLATPPPNSREEYAAQMLAAYRVIGSPAFELDEAALRERSLRAYDRGHDRAGMMRQAVASLATGDRTAGLRGVTAPTLVIHGDADVLLDASGGRATADAVPCARLVIVEGMGHDLPPGAWPRLVDEIARHVTLAERVRA